MRVVLLAATGFAIFTVALFALAGRWVASRTRRAEHLTDRILLRAHRRTLLILCAVTLLGIVAVLLARPRLPRAFGIVAAYTGPFLWIWALVAGASWLELAARGIDTDLWRFHRFDVFATFLLMGQRIPFFSAACVAGADLTVGGATAASLGMYFLIALLFGVALRWLVVHRLVRTRPFPDLVLETDIVRTADRSGVRLRQILLVPTERGQSVNAVAATSSRTIFVAQGLVEGLERGELRAVLLHELGHFAQPLTNAFRNAAVLGWPLVIWGLRALAGSGMGRGTAPAMIGLVALAVGGSLLARMIYRSSEIRADRFAERWSPPGALAAALRKLYERPVTLGLPMRRSTHRPPALDERLKGLMAPPEKTPVG
jgi:Zn-dependent protease with chaperone function